MFLLDTVIVSELRKKRPDAGVVRWISKQQDDLLYLSVVTLGEIERGIEKRRKVDTEFADELAAWLESLMRLYADRILPVTPSVARRWGRLSAQLGHDGADLLIAASALTHGLTVVTRNAGHFEPTGVSLINPFSR
jgi:predicted nucleic acid-binding protein